MKKKSKLTNSDPGHPGFPKVSSPLFSFSAGFFLLALKKFFNMAEHSSSRSPPSHSAT